MSIQRTLGPNSGALRLRSLDGRTYLGKFTKTVRAELVSALGGAPSPGQCIIIDMAVVKIARLRMLSEHILLGELPAEEADRRFTWFSNSLRRDLIALGLDRTPDLHGWPLPRRNRR